jgi:hypothetical protein
MAIEWPDVHPCVWLSQPDSLKGDGRNLRADLSCPWPRTKRKGERGIFIDTSSRFWQLFLKVTASGP